jgi:geranylgeranyl reductase family protein
VTQPSVSFDVLIAGAGPAGLATALHLLRARPDLAGRVAAIDKARHPRRKTCAGGLIPKTILALEELGLELAVPNVVVTGGRARTEVGEVNYPSGRTLCTIIRRDEFDSWLARVAADWGLVLIEDTRIIGVESRPDQVVVRTARGDFTARLLIGADGSGSRVRASLFDSSKASIGRALMTDVPVDSTLAEEFVRSCYRFDFRCVSFGVKGYSWSFPCLIGGKAHLNVGIYDQHSRRCATDRGTRANLLDQLRTAFPELPLGEVGLRPASYQAFAIRWFNPRDSYAARNVILVGDAAGCDPLMGEGISYAFEHGKLAAQAAQRYLDADPAALSTYNDALHHAAVGRKLGWLGFAARRFYGPRHRLYFQLAMQSRRAQEIGIDWYNGENHLDQVPAQKLLAKWARLVLSSHAVR